MAANNKPVQYVFTGVHLLLAAEERVCSIVYYICIYADSNSPELSNEEDGRNFLDYHLKICN